MALAPAIYWSGTFFKEKVEMSFPIHARYAFGFVKEFVQKVVNFNK